VSLDAKGGNGMKNADPRRRRPAHGGGADRKGQARRADAPTIQSELSNASTSRACATEEANDLALLMRAGIAGRADGVIERAHIGPTSGRQHRKGFDSVKYGFAAIAVFMCAYYLLFGVDLDARARLQLLLWWRCCRSRRRTLTLAGIAPSQLTLGMAHRRQRADQRAHPRGAARRRSPQAAINIGYERAFATDPRLET
jgi:preprotein translocase subunit SecD